MIKLKRKRIILFIFLIVMILFSISLGYGQKVEEKKEGSSYLIVTVREGDTLWNIACEHGSKGKDIRSIVHKIRQINQLESPVVYPGQQIRIPEV
ncbi:MAG: LysM peptidoglycan-binding domain-containing protein [Candidatus Syntrophonatronum acetioxidans]|uniref:LysM peptidoglycan-binding domain-containing protein n=1 Tax=Candidatus Syntrophonatronum acetioxidans TaxID=1795816 RepID=A0A424YI56_9FIRM|nr:MAG: LysM peptidoglycan-binding domain-containing protein [Candidatus Syntrophonatronum acetioxidans]